MLSSRVVLKVSGSQSVVCDQHHQHGCEFVRVAVAVVGLAHADPRNQKLGERCPAMVLNKHSQYWHDVGRHQIPSGSFQKRRPWVPAAGGIGLGPWGSLLSGWPQLSVWDMKPKRGV